MIKRQTSERSVQTDPWVIRRGQRADAAALLAYFEAIAAETPNNTSIRPQTAALTVEAVSERIDRYVRDPRSAMFLGVQRSRVIGYVTLTGETSPFTAHQVELSINVHADWRGCGLGSALLQTALSWARAQAHVERVQLEALTRNVAAVRLYQRYGFVVEGVRRNAYRLVDEPDSARTLDATQMAYLIPRHADGTPRATQERRRWQEG